MKTILFGLRIDVIRLAGAVCLLVVCTSPHNTCSAQIKQHEEAPKDPFLRKPASNESESARSIVAALDSPAANDLLAQLQTQEAAAVAEAEAIRLQMSGAEPKPDEPTIKQRKARLNGHLAAAFDLKLQLEDLQIKELQTRLDQLERQTADRKAVREKIINRRASELLDGEGLKWQPASARLIGPGKSDDREAVLAKSKEFLKSRNEQLQPFQDRIAACQQRIRLLEPVYFKDRSNAAELQQAWDALTEARREAERKEESFQQPMFAIAQQLQLELQSAQQITRALESHGEKKSQQLADGLATESEYKAALTAAKRAWQSESELKERLEAFGFREDGWNGLYTIFRESPDAQGPAQSLNLDESQVRAWLEAALSVKLDFIPLEGLNLPFKTAVRVRESPGGNYQAGDLIVGFMNHRLVTPNQIAGEMCEMEKRYEHTHGSDTDDSVWNTVLRGSLGATPSRILAGYGHFGNSHNARRRLLGGGADDAAWHLEVRVRGEKPTDLRTLYVSAMCVSPEGILAIPISSEKLADQQILVYSPERATARVVGSDDKHEVTLLKIEGFQREFFDWIRCRLTPPAVGQNMTAFKSIPTMQRGQTQSQSMSAIATQPDGSSGAFDDSQFHIKVDKGLPIGSAVMTVDKELQGILKSDTDAKTQVCIAAQTIDILLKDYRSRQRNVREQTISQSHAKPIGSETDDDAVLISAREKMRPFVDKVAACQQRVRELEPAYFRDRSNTPELQKAWDALNDARREVSDHVGEVEFALDRIRDRLNRQVAAADEVASALKAQRERKAELLADGQVTEAELKSAIAASDRATEALAAANRKYEAFSSASLSIVPDGAKVLWTANLSKAPTIPLECDDSTVLTWLERSLELKLEFVRFDDLNLPYPAALRVCEVSGDYQANDLIVMVGDYHSTFQSLSQLGNELCRFCKDNPLNDHPNTVLRGGLAGPLVQTREPGWKWTEARDYLLGTRPLAAIWHFEVRTPGSGESRGKTVYISGVCVSVDGLVAILFPVDQLTDPENIPVTVPQGGLARVVAADKTNGITLLKISAAGLANRKLNLESTSGLAYRGLFHWVNCRSVAASPGQALRIFHWPPQSNVSTCYAATPPVDIEKGALEPDTSRFFIALVPFDGNKLVPRWSAEPVPMTTKDPKILASLTPGSPVATNDNELQGIIGRSNSDDQGSRLCVSASVIRELIRDYRRSERLKSGGKATLSSTDKPYRSDDEPSRPTSNANDSPTQVARTKRDLLPAFLLSASKVSQQSLDAGVAHAVDLATKDPEILELIVAELKTALDAGDEAQGVKHRLLSVLSKTCQNYGSRRWRPEPTAVPQTPQPSQSTANGNAGKQQDVDTRVLIQIIALGYRADRITIDQLTLAVRNLHHVEGMDFLRDVLREDGKNQPFKAANSPSRDSPPKPGRSKWADNIGGGWRDARFVAAVGLAELSDHEGVEFLLNHAKPNRDGIDSSLFHIPHSRDTSGSLRKSSVKSLVDLFGADQDATYEKLQSWWDSNKEQFQPRIVQLK